MRGLTLTMAYYPKTAYPANACDPGNANPRLAGVLAGLRYYSPSLGRWLSRDPIGEGASVALSVAMANDMICGTDPIGLFESSALINQWVRDPIDLMTSMQFLGVSVAQVSLGGDPWLPSFLLRYFFGVGTTLTLSTDDIRNISSVPPVLSVLALDAVAEAIRLNGWHEQDIAAGTQYGFVVANAGAGNATLGEFGIEFEGGVKCDPARIEGRFRLLDRFDFDWKPWRKRGLVGELRLRAFSLMTHGMAFDVRSDWIPVIQLRSSPERAEW